MRALAQNYAGAVILGVNPRVVSLTIYLCGIVATAGGNVTIDGFNPGSGIVYGTVNAANGLGRDDSFRRNILHHTWAACTP